MFDDLEARLQAAGYFRDPAKAPVMRHNLRNILHRMELTEQDVKTLRGVIRALSGKGPSSASEPGIVPSDNPEPSSDREKA
jgi:tRNA/rRNA methyltransferase